jgi:hypothetical protein
MVVYSNKRIQEQIPCCFFSHRAASVTLQVLHSRCRCDGNMSGAVILGFLWVRHNAELALLSASLCKSFLLQMLFNNSSRDSKMLALCDLGYIDIS